MLASFTGAECPLWGYGCYRRVSGKALPISRFCKVDRKNMSQPPQKVCNQLEKSLQEVARLCRRLERIERMRVRVYWNLQLRVQILAKQLENDLQRSYQELQAIMQENGNN